MKIPSPRPNSPSQPLKNSLCEEVQLCVSLKSVELVKRLKHNLIWLATKWFEHSGEGSCPLYEVRERVTQAVVMVTDYLRLCGLESLLYPLVVYIERYVTTVGKLDPVNVYDIFLTSVVITIKYWYDQQTTNTYFSKFFNVPLEEVRDNEAAFLGAINFDLSLSETEQKLWNSFLELKNAANR